MLLAAPSLESYSICGYTTAGMVHRVARPAYSEVAAASPGTGSHTRLCADLNNIVLDCQRPGWDGYGAQPVSWEAYQLAKRFIHSLPPGIPRPLISADPEGCVTFEWQVSPRRLVLVSVHPDYRIDYAALFGSGESHGTEPFFDVLPPGLCDLVRRVYQV